jgi:hypothetical protein
MKPVIRLFLFQFILVGLIGCLDRIPKSTNGTVIDYDTKLPLEGAFVRDSESGDFIITDKSGRFCITGIMPVQKIEITKKEYNPFSLEIKINYKNNKEMFKSYKLIDERNWIENENKYNEFNSNSFSIINGDSLIIELEQCKKRK